MVDGSEDVASRVLFEAVDELTLQELGRSAWRASWIDVDTMSPVKEYVHLCGNRPVFWAVSVPIASPGADEPG